jgi:hypothetical protein
MYRVVGLPLLACVGLALAAAASGASAQSAQSGGLSIELNRLEAADKACRAYFVIENPGDKAFPALKLDLVLFQADGVISKRLTLDMGPLRAAKTTVKQFDIDGQACDKVAKVHVNDAVECKSEPAATADCLQGLAVKSLVPNVALTK